ncbi:anaerobic carbon-monoxide dehydrogenase catalytic subunit [Natranaerofaba carboxydovora]|uniref:anaerobic carbon-monoxide dehydrogenase catalytic subunit n=1 Tax=Natranaerofaba carboxydovora TaxID=2742683 RepID=UPI001F149781|nr:anaerobic carbon-monoxide dehydrogenase catalytic subunit [Natranaerofaba carboxydovora]UMZ72599.1 Carbon monoxide dehydrogenase 2 [Natranaerofaba carboxydovora]
MIKSKNMVHRKDGRISVHDSVQEMYEKLSKEGLTNTFDRFDPMERIRCNYCRQGISCQLCTNGPCRISDKADVELGVCGIDRNAMSMRDMLLRNVMGASTYAHHAYEAFRTLKSTANGKTPYEIKDTDKLYNLAEIFGLNTSGSKEDVAVRLAEFFMEELHHDYDRPSEVVEKFALRYRKIKWRDLGIYPAGLMHEIKDATASCLTNVDGDHVSMAKKAMRLGIATIYGAQLGLEMVQDIMFGTPMPHEVDVDFGIMDPDYVNLVFNGHEPWMGAAAIKAAKDPKNQQKAKDAGAKGIRVVGSIETGQELLQRFPMDDVFVGHIGNWLAIEPLLATGTVDVFAMDENCSPPALKPYADKYQVTLVAVSDLVRMPGVEKILDYKPPEVAQMAQQLIDWGIENFQKRKDTVTPHVPNKVTKATAGFSSEAVLNVLGGSIDPLLDVIKEGHIKGIVAIVNCTTLSNGPHDYMTVNLVKELIKKDILVIAGGCGCHGLEVAGLTNTEAINQAGEGLKAVCNKLNIPPVLPFGTCTDTGRISMLVTHIADALDVDVSDLPIAVSAPQYLEQKATIDGVFALAYGTLTHLSPTPQVTGAPDLVELLTDQVEGLTGGKIMLGDEPTEAAKKIASHINSKREKLLAPQGS